MKKDRIQMGIVNVPSTTDMTTMIQLREFKQLMMIFCIDKNGKVVKKPVKSNRNIRNISFM